MNKCKHNKEFCCECKYGKIRESYEPHSQDTVDDLNCPVGYKMLKGHMGDIKEGED